MTTPTDTTTTSDTSRNLDELTAALDARAVNIWRAYHYGEDPGDDGCWPADMYPDGLPDWAALVLVRAVAGNRLCRIECVRCGASGAPLHHHDHAEGCDYQTFTAPRPMNTR